MHAPHPFQKQPSASCGSLPATWSSTFTCMLPFWKSLPGGGGAHCPGQCCPSCLSTFHGTLFTHSVLSTSSSHICHFPPDVAFPKKACLPFLSVFGVCIWTPQYRNILSSMSFSVSLMPSLAILDQRISAFHLRASNTSTISYTTREIIIENSVERI